MSDRILSRLLFHYTCHRPSNKKGIVRSGKILFKLSDESEDSRSENKSEVAGRDVAEDSTNDSHEQKLTEAGADVCKEDKVNVDKAVKDEQPSRSETHYVIADYDIGVDGCKNTLDAWSLSQHKFVYVFTPLTEPGVLHIAGEWMHEGKDEVVYEERVCAFKMEQSKASYMDEPEYVYHTRLWHVLMDTAEKAQQCGLKIAYVFVGDIVRLLDIHIDGNQGLSVSSPVGQYHTKIPVPCIEVKCNDKTFDNLPDTVTVEYQAIANYRVDYKRSAKLNPLYSHVLSTEVQAVELLPFLLEATGGSSLALVYGDSDTLTAFNKSKALIAGNKIFDKCTKPFATPLLLSSDALTGDGTSDCIQICYSSTASHTLVLEFIQEFAPSNIRSKVCENRVLHASAHQAGTLYSTAARGALNTPRILRVCKPYWVCRYPDPSDRSPLLMGKAKTSYTHITIIAVSEEKTVSHWDAKGALCEGVNWLQSKNEIHNRKGLFVIVDTEAKLLLDSRNTTSNTATTATTTINLESNEHDLNSKVMFDKGSTCVAVIPWSKMKSKVKSADVVEHLSQAVSVSCVDSYVLVDGDEISDVFKNADTTNDKSVLPFLSWLLAGIDAEQIQFASMKRMENAHIQMRCTFVSLEMPKVPRHHPVFDDEDVKEGNSVELASPRAKAVLGRRMFAVSNIPDNGCLFLVRVLLYLVSVPEIKDKTAMNSMNLQTRETNIFHCLHDFTTAEIIRSLEMLLNNTNDIQRVLLRLALSILLELKTCIVTEPNGPYAEAPMKEKSTKLLPTFAKYYTHHGTTKQMSSYRPCWEKTVEEKISEVVEKIQCWTMNADGIAQRFYPPKKKDTDLLTLLTEREPKVPDLTTRLFFNAVGTRDTVMVEELLLHTDPGEMVANALYAVWWLRNCITNGNFDSEGDREKLDISAMNIENVAKDMIHAIYLKQGNGDVLNRLLFLKQQHISDIRTLVFFVGSGLRSHHIQHMVGSFYEAYKVFLDYFNDSEAHSAGLCAMFAILSGWLQCVQRSRHKVSSPISLLFWFSSAVQLCDAHWFDV